ncbi:MAG: hypothetical protein Q9171_001677 [Xanthocarpia ochracea]
MNTSECTTGLVAMPPVDNDNAQRWLIADVSATEKMLINNGTGANLCAIKGSSFTRATSTPPYDLKARWTIDFDRYSDYPGSRHLLEHLESPPSVPPTPAPPAPGPCEFPEVHQQTLRGDVVEGCNKFRFANTVTQSARDFYDEMKLNAEEYNIQSYVFTSSVELGSPDGQGPGVIALATKHDRIAFLWVRFANKINLPFLAINRGHGSVSALGTFKHGVLIKLDNLTSIVIAADGKSAVLGG